MQKKFDKTDFERQQRIGINATVMNEQKLYQSKDNSRIQTSQEMNEIHDSSQIGFTRLDRKNKLRHLKIYAFFFFLFFVNISMVISYSLVLNYKSLNSTGKNHFAWDELTQMCCFFLAYNIVILGRLWKCLFLIRAWKDESCNPTIIEAKVEFYSFFSLGFVECWLQVAGLIISHDKFVENYSSKTSQTFSNDAIEHILEYQMKLILVYGWVNITLYVLKGLLLMLAYCYFKFYGGLETEESQDDELQRESSN